MFLVPSLSFVLLLRSYLLGWVGGPVLRRALAAAAMLVDVPGEDEIPKPSPGRRVLTYEERRQLQQWIQMAERGFQMHRRAALRSRMGAWRSGSKSSLDADVQQRIVRIGACDRSSPALFCTPAIRYDQIYSWSTLDADAQKRIVRVGASDRCLLRPLVTPRAGTIS